MALTEKGAEGTREIRATTPPGPHPRHGRHNGRSLGRPPLYSIHDWAESMCRCVAPGQGYICQTLSADTDQLGTRRGWVASVVERAEMAEMAERMGGTERGLRWCPSMSAIVPWRWHTMLDRSTWKGGLMRSGGQIPNRSMHLIADCQAASCAAT